MTAEILSVGTELLLGDIVNTNAQYLAQQLAELGFSVFYQTVVGDNPARLQAAVQTAKQRSDVLLFTGGLGPTDDDLTKTTVAEVFGDTLQEDPAEVEKLKSFFAAFTGGRKMTPNNLKQAMVPVKGGKFENPNGTAPGVWFKEGERYAFLMPGPPREMRPMFLTSVRPMLEKMQQAVICSHTLHVFGVGESELEGRIQELLNGQNPTAALYAKTGEVHIRVTARAKTAAEGDAMCNGVDAKLREVLGDRIYAENGDDLETTAVKALAAQNATVATAESCTGGLLSGRITSVPGASAVFGFGVCSYANEAKRKLLGVSAETLASHGAVSSQTAGEMAFGAQTLGTATYGIGITGVAGPDGGTKEKPVGLVYISVCDGQTVYIKKVFYPDRARDYVRHMATQHALDMLRRLALGLPQRGTQSFAKGTPAAWKE